MALYTKRPRLDEEQIGRGIAKFADTLLNTRSCVFVCSGAGGGGGGGVWVGGGVGGGGGGGGGLGGGRPALVLDPPLQYKTLQIQSINTPS